MHLPRLFQSLFLAFVLLFAQQAGAAHVLHHALEDLTQHQDDKQTSHSDTCGKCADFAQLSSALNVGVHSFVPLVVFDEMVQFSAIPFRSIRILSAAARAPPYSI